MRSVIDSHVHLSNDAFIPELGKIAQNIGAEKLCLVSIAEKNNVNDNPAVYKAKSVHPDKYYAFAALDHSAQYLSEAQVPDYAQQVQIAIDLGADGIKLLETKPDRRKHLDIPIDSEIYEPMFALLEQRGFPIIWHVADPEEFWDPATTPGWAREHNWGYDPSFIAKEQLYKEVDNVLNRHPQLKVIFAHFYFLSADLDRAALMFKKYENVHFDLAPGIEMLYNLSKTPSLSKEFFCKHSDRIVFGTDIGDFLTATEAEHRAQLIFDWLETNREFRVPEGADFLLGPAEDGIIRGMSLPKETLDQIYCANFEAIVDTVPATLDMEKTAAELARINQLRALLRVALPE